MILGGIILDWVYNDIIDEKPRLNVLADNNGVQVAEGRRGAKVLGYNVDKRVVSERIEVLVDGVNRK